MATLSDVAAEAGVSPTAVSRYLNNRIDLPQATRDRIDAAIPNICRCGIYPRLRDSIRRAARIRSGEERVAASPPPRIAPVDAARAVPALRPPRGVPR